MKNTKKVRWQIVCLLFFATTINYIDRQIIGILKPYIAEDLGWTEADYGYIVSSFQIAYAIGLLLVGRLLDVFGTKRGYIISVVLWSIACLAHAAARTVGSFMAVRFFLGLGESGNFPASIKTVAEWFPKKERALATGLFNSGSTIGAIIAPIVVSAITLAWGWRWAFVITGLIGFVWVIFWLIGYELPNKHKKLSVEEYDYIHQDKEEVSKEKYSWSKLFKYKETWVICFTRFISDWVWWFFLFWIPDYLSKQHHIELKNLVFPLIIIYAVSSVGGIFGGWFSSKLISQGKSIDYSRKLAVLICALFVVPVFFLNNITDLSIAVLLIALAAAGHQGWASNIFTVVSDIYPKNAIGSVSGLCGFAGAVGGALSASFIGIILDNTGSYSLIFLIASSVYLLNWLILKVFIKKIEPITL